MNALAGSVRVLSARGVGRLLLGLPLLLAGGCASEEPAAPASGEEIGTVEQAACGTASGDWADFPKGDGTLQCVGGVRQFYDKKFNAFVPPASGGPVGNCAQYGACNIWVNTANRPNPKEWNRYDWGSKKPQTYDMVVFPPTSGNAYGHIASVDHVSSGGVLYVMDANWSPWKGHKAACVHDVGSYKPYGFYRLKSLEPVSCDRSAGGFTFSCDGTVKGKTCVNVKEPADSEWSNDYFCGPHDMGMKWSSAGAISGMTCTSVKDNADGASSPWADNFLCLPPQTPYAFTFSGKGAIAGKNCVQWNEPKASKGWKDNFLCTDKVLQFTSGHFTFSSKDAVAGKTCVNVNEPGDADTAWKDNYFCSDAPVGMKWSNSGPIAGMTCTNVKESADSKAAAWANNYICLPKDAPYKLTWSSSGPLAGKDCVRWFDHAETSVTWWDNWMCAEDVASSGDGGKGGSAGAMSGAGGNDAGGSDAGGKAGSSAAGKGGSAGAGGKTASQGGAGGSSDAGHGSAAGGAAGSSGIQGGAAGISGGAGKGGAAGKSGAAGVAGALSLGDEAVPGATAESAGCALGPDAPRASGKPALLLAAAALVAGLRRRRGARGR
jgi:hypothetical protein